ncbi:sensor domain-containing diguanylate cyclase [Mesorhizobium sp. CAU 1741]|uniref:sensor domain-containing diguanylate cyclase n=1 Tax=Mesorhizobium sp. CAU 1741 TaxID=3140366 RepID=UPI00325BD40D
MTKPTQISWKEAPVANQQEAGRLSALDRLDLLDTPRDEAFARIVRLIQNIFNVPLGLVSLMDGHRQWHMACPSGMDGEAERKDTFCQYPVATGQSLVIRDASQDPLFAHNPHVLADNGIRFYAGVPLRTRDGHTIGTVCAVGPEPRQFDARELQILTDLADMAMGEIELRQQAGTDVLTGLLSRREFKERASHAIMLGLRHKYPVSCAVIDVDHFKLVNDTHGHAVGDEVLREIAGVCQRELRATDVLGRLGGEEFAAILPHTSLADAVEAAEKLRKAVKLIRVESENVIIKVTASIGLAGMDSVAEDLDMLLARADKALYEAKDQGRDRCVSFRTAVVAGPRRRVLKGGRIIFNNRFSAIDCTLRSLGDEGAEIDVWNPHDIPEKFTLIIAPENVERSCLVVGRTDKRIEVQFT